MMETLKVRELLFGLRYVLSYRLLANPAPLICGLNLHNRCNLKCHHCRITERSDESLTFEDSKKKLDLFYNEGGRTVYFEGGEPFLWHDGKYKLEDLVRYARCKGYLSSVVYTNGTFPIETSADTVFISIDGLKDTNDHLRGSSFDRVIENINRSDHSSQYINFTINNLNKNEILDFCEFINGFNKIKGIFFYFHTPYYGYDELYIDRRQREKILETLIRNKRRYKILNSYAGLKSALRNDWERPLEICRIYEGEKVFTCCRFEGNKDLCSNCGYLSYAEINQVLKFKTSAIWNAIKYF
jgi:MoaA/NifB/PqqE/SkfB family radical SAM enzyme